MSTRVNTNPEKTHRIVVGIAVGLIAVAGVGTLVVSANHHVIARDGQAVAPAAPAAAYPDTLAPQVGESADASAAPAALPPISDSPLPPAASASQPASTAPPVGAPPSAANLAPTAARDGDEAATVDQRAARVAATDRMKSAPAGESAVVTAGSRLAETNATTTAFGNGQLMASAGEQAHAAFAEAANSSRL